MTIHCIITDFQFLKLKPIPHLQKRRDVRRQLGSVERASVYTAITRPYNPQQTYIKLK